MILRLIVQLVILVRGFVLSGAEENITSDIPMPLSVNMSTMNCNHIIRWSYPFSRGDSNVQFEAQSKDFFDIEWTTECVIASQRSCDILSIVRSVDEKCQGYSGEYEGRVRACVPTGLSTKNCSSWAVANKLLEFPNQDKFSAPIFNIVGVFHGTQLRILNRPIIAKYTNFSLNCFYDGELEYKIIYWIDNDGTNSTQERISSFERETIYLPLSYEPKQTVQICVKMAIQYYYVRNAKWKTKCVAYTPPNISVLLQPVQLAGIIIGIVVLLIVVMSILLLLQKFKKMYNKGYGRKINVPADLDDLMNDAKSERFVLEMDAEESVEMINFQTTIEEEKHQSNTKYEHNDECAPVISGGGGSTTSPNDRFASTETIPYITDVNTDCSFTIGGDGGEENGKSDFDANIPVSSENYSSLCAMKNALNPSINEEKPPFTIAQLARARLLSNSTGDMSGQTEEKYLQSRRCLSAVNLSNANLNIYFTAKKYSDMESSQKYELDDVDTSDYVTSTNILKQSHKNADRVESKSCDEDAVTLRNPTYNPDPDIFDFLDENYYQMGNKLHFEGRKSPVRSATALLQRRIISNKLLKSESDLSPLKIFIPEIIDAPTHNSNLPQPRSTPFCESIKMSTRCRVSSTDSGYQMDSFSTSDGCSLSPPMSPDEKTCVSTLRNSSDKNNEYITEYTTVYCTSKSHVIDDQSPYVTESSMS